ncbi:MAG: aminotransferase class III-fold pyridoxal phosphate-dependent enzyme [Gemmatimonadota bacterium]
MYDTGKLLSEYDAEDIIEKDKRHVWHHLFQHKVLESQDPKIFVEGDGVRVRDISGREYLDGASGGVWCVNVGYGRESMARVIHDQLLKLPYYAGVAGTVPGAEFADKLSGLLPGLDHIFFSNSGSEANEKAFKMVRQAAHLSGSGKYKIVYRDRDYHGTTIACLAASGQPERKEQFGPFPDGFVSMPHALCYRCPFGLTYPDCGVKCAQALEDVLQQEDPDSVGAVLLEPITAGGGVIPPVDEYYTIVREICDRHDVFLIMDEVVCGFGRTGTMFGFEHYDVVPDIVTMAKGMASSYAPISATAARDRVFDRFVNDPSNGLAYFRDISTYGGCTAGLAAALENLRILQDEALVENSRVMGAYLNDRLRELEDHRYVGDLRGRGLFAGIELVLDKSTKEPMREDVMGVVQARVAQEGVLIGKTTRSFRGLNNTLNIAPPLIVTKADVDEIVEAVKVGIDQGCKQVLG